MPCPADTTLTPIRICGSVQEICPVDEPQDLRVLITLVNPGDIVKDPTTDGLIVGGVVYDETIEDSVDGCWCTCELLPNVASGDSQSLAPNNTGYKVQVVWGSTPIIDTVIQLDADGEYLLDDNTECGECVNICTLLGEIPQLPPPATFCDMVEACLPPETVTPMTVVGSVVGYTDELGNATTFDICSIVNDFCPETVTAVALTATGFTYTNEAGDVVAVDFPTPPAPSTFTDNGDGSWTHDDGTGVAVDIFSTSADATNVASVGPDGGTLITETDICAAVNNSCPATVVTNADGTLTITGTDDSTGTTAPPTVDTDTFMTAVETSPGVFDFTNADGTPGVTVDTTEVIVSADAGNLVTVGVDGGAFIDCETIQDCVGTALSAVDGIVYDDAGNSITVTIVDSNGVPLVPNPDGTYMLPPAAAAEVGGATVTTDAAGNVTIAATDVAGNATTATIAADVDVLTAACETEAGDLLEIIDGATDDEDEVRFRIDPNGPVIETCDGPTTSKGPGCNGFRKGPNGGAAVHYEDFTEIGAAAEGPLTITPTAASVGAGWEDVSSEIEVTLTNPSPCDNMKYIAIFVLGGTAYRPSAGNSWLVGLQYDNGGGAFISATNSWVGNGTGSVVTSPDTLKMPATSFPQVGTVLPCQSRVLRSKVRRLVQTFAAGPDLLTLNDGSSHFIRVLGTTGN